MAFDIAQILNIFISVFAIVNPLGNIPSFLALTEGYSKEEKMHVILKIVLIASGVLVVFGLIGNYIFQMFSITVPAFRIAGGMLIIRVAFSMMQGQRSQTKITHEELQDALEREAVGITPLAVPLFAGPGAITTVMLYIGQFSQEGRVLPTLWVFASILLTMGASGILLKYASQLNKYLGKSGLMVFSRIMGLILAAIGVQFIINGVSDIVFGLMSGAV
ncbi:MAG: MarC family protein [Candidatus Thermoplasmatota archaeon]|nr:MarC family protein [Candidatus Thermoplasmatota archaeon]